MNTYTFTHDLTYHFVDWRITLVLKHHRGHRVTEEVGWEVIEFSIQQVCNKEEEEDDICQRPSCRFELPPQEYIDRVRAWLNQHMLVRTINLVVPYSVNKDNMDSNNAWLRAMLALDADVAKLAGIGNEL